MSLRELEEKLKLDKHELDRELMEQPQLFYEVARAYTQAVSERDGLYDRRKSYEADLAVNIRQEALDKGTKMTDKAVEQAIQADAKRRKLIRRHTDKSAEAERLGALREAFMQRAQMLREMCGLWANGYFQSSSAGGAPKQVAEAGYEQRKDRINQQRKRVK